MTKLECGKKPDRAKKRGESILVLPESAGIQFVTKYVLIVYLHSNSHNALTG